MRWTVLLLAALVSTAGCIGFSDDGEGADGNNTTDDDFDLNETESTNQTSSDGWQSENRSGTVEGAALPVGPTGTEETFTLENGTVALALNLTADGGELELSISPPDCEDASCEESVTTQDGNASYSTTDPTAGEWTVTLSPATPGVSSIEYELVIAWQGPEA